MAVPWRPGETTRRGPGSRWVTYSPRVGEKVMSELHDIDEVAYVRFASVYRQFKDVTDFMKEVGRLLKRDSGDNE